PEGIHNLQWVVNDLFLSGSIAVVDEVTYVPGAVLPLFVSKPSSAVLAAGADITFAATTGGTPVLTNEWQFNGNILPAEKGTSLVLTNVQPDDSGVYTLTVRNGYGSTNQSVTLTVTNSGPYIRTQPASLEMVRNGNAFFSVFARGSDPLNYQWQFNQADIPNATNASLLLTQIQTNSAGTYRVIITNTFGSITSTNVTLAVVPTVIVGWGQVFTSSPNPPAGLTNVSAISAGEDFSVALRNNGTVFVWGWNAFSKLSVPAGLGDVVAVSAGGMHGSALRSDGSLVDWGDPFFDSSANVPPDLFNVIQTSAGDEFNIALKNDQTFVVWGDNFLGPLNVAPELTNNTVSVAAGQYHGLALRQNGTVASWGYNTSGQTNVPAGLSNVVAVAAGYAFSLALLRDGSIVSWGSSGATNIPAEATNLVSIAAGRNHALALKPDGTVIAWGVGSAGQTSVPFWLTNVVAISGGSTHSLALLNDGTPYVIRQPWNLVAWSGTDIQFDAAALGQAPLAYQWQFNGTDLTGATNASLALTNLLVTQAGNYRCIISNSVGSVSTRLATLTVLRGTPQFVSGGTGFDNVGAFRLLLSGISGHGNIVLYASTNLVDWQPVFTNPPAAGELLFTDSSATNFPQRFYKFEEQ
ncbi:MAG TPA: hypothetical protein VK327_15720, partial [Candidatus Paceibacterota bacterium]|nr:hypothetical protein [Candidatus Paceibacterota bacterium]